MGQEKSTGPLKNHANRCESLKKHPTYVAQLKGLSVQDYQSSSVSSSKTLPSSSSGKPLATVATTLKNYGFNRNEEEKRKAIEFVIMEFLPLHTLQRPSFRRLIQACNSQIPDFGKDSVRNFIS